MKQFYNYNWWIITIVLAIALSVFNLFSKLSSHRGNGIILLFNVMCCFTQVATVFLFCVNIGLLDYFSLTFHLKSLFLNFVVFLLWSVFGIYCACIIYTFLSYKILFLSAVFALFTSHLHLSICGCNRRTTDKSQTKSLQYTVQHKMSTTFCHYMFLTFMAVTNYRRTCIYQHNEIVV